jgi:hypothetical protein
VAVRSSLAASLLLLASAGAPPAPGAGPGPRFLTHGELAARPRDFLHVPVELHVQVEAPLERWNPYFTRFGSDDYAAVTAWADDQLPWVKEDFEHPAVRLFARRGSRAEELLAAAERHERFRVLAVVRELCAGRAWIEALVVRPLSERIPEGTVIHAERALRLIEQGAYELALGELDRALGPDLPPVAEEELRRLRALCEERRAAHEPTEETSAR